MLSHQQLYEKISSKKGNGVKIPSSLCFYNPMEVYEALTKNEDIRLWLDFIANHYNPPTRQVLLVYPCSAIKPYHISRSYRRLFLTLDELGERRKQVHVITISEPFGLVPEEFYQKKNEWHDWKNLWYDCPGLFEWWCKVYGQNYDEWYLEESIDILSDYVARFLERVESRHCYGKVIAFVRTFSSSLRAKRDHTHRRIIEKASEKARVKVTLLPDKQAIEKIVKNRGKMAWDLYGVSHPIAQEFLLNYLKNNLV
jgi:archaeosine synthase